MIPQWFAQSIEIFFLLEEVQQIGLFHLNLEKHNLPL